MGQMFSKLINHRINACFLKGTCLNRFLVNLHDKITVTSFFKKACSMIKHYIARKHTCLTLNRFTAFAYTSIWTSSEFFHFKHIKQQRGHRNEGTSGFSDAIKHLYTPKAYREVTRAGYKTCHAVNYLGQWISQRSEFFLGTTSAHNTSPKLKAEYVLPIIKFLVRFLHKKHSSATSNKILL